MSDASHTITLPRPAALKLAKALEAAVASLRTLRAPALGTRDGYRGMMAQLDCEAGLSVLRAAIKAEDGG